MRVLLIKHNKSTYIFILTFILISIAFFCTSSKIVLFYDAPEYTEIVTNNNFFNAIKMGHTPIHPVFIAFLWLLTRFLTIVFDVGWEYAGNLSAVFGGLTSVILFYLISIRFISNKNNMLLSLLIFLFYPAVWIINTNLMVESLSLPLFLFSIFSANEILEKKNKIYDLIYITSVVLLIGTHIQTIFWLPAISGFYTVVKNYPTSSIIHLIKLTFIGIIFSILLYLTIFTLDNKSLKFELYNLFFAHTGTLDYISPIGYLRMLRNVLLNTARGYGSLTIAIIGFLILSSIKHKKSLSGWLLITAAIVIQGAIWSGDFMPRRLVFMAPILSILVVKQFRKISLIYLVYLTILLIPNLLLYSQKEINMPISLIKQSVKSIPEGQVYLQTHYLSPFIDYNGEYVYIDSIKTENINKLFEENKRIFIDTYGISAPYYLPVGNNLHITSVQFNKNTPAQSIFEQHYVCPIETRGQSNSIIVYEITRNKNCKAVSILPNQPGEVFAIYSPHLKDKVKRERIDYGDIFTWLWYLAANKEDPITWIYADKSGKVYLPQKTN